MAQFAEKTAMLLQGIHAAGNPTTAAAGGGGDINVLQSTLTQLQRQQLMQLQLIQQLQHSLVTGALLGEGPDAAHAKQMAAALATLQSLPLLAGLPGLPAHPNPTLLLTGEQQLQHQQQHLKGDSRDNVDTPPKLYPQGAKSSSVDNNRRSSSSRPATPHSPANDGKSEINDAENDAVLNGNRGGDRDGTSPRPHPLIPGANSSTTTSRPHQKQHQHDNQESLLKQLNHHAGVASSGSNPPSPSTSPGADQRDAHHSHHHRHHSQSQHQRRRGGSVAPGDEDDDDEDDAATATISSNAATESGNDAAVTTAAAAGRSPLEMLQQTTATFNALSSLEKKFKGMFEGRFCLFIFESVIFHLHV